MGAVQVATIASTPIPAFAEGGLVSGATLGLIGEGPGTSVSNPEVIVPLDKLKNMRRTILKSNSRGRNKWRGHILN